MNRIIEISEYQRIPIGTADSESPIALSKAQAEELRRLESHLPRKAFSWGHNCIIWGSYCGLLPLSDVTIEISPKLHSDRTDVAHGREVLIKLLSETGVFKLHRSSTTHIGRHQNKLLDIFIMEFCAELTVQLRQGAARAYQQNTANLPLLRGKLLVDQHLKQNQLLQNRLYCQFDELTHDIPINRLIRTTLTALSAVAGGATAKRKLTELHHELEGVSAITPGQAISQKLIFDRNTERFKPVVNKCRQFLAGLYPDIVSGSAPGIGLLFNMNTLFEQWLGRVFRALGASSGFSWQTQGPARHLAQEYTQPGKSVNRFLLKPDFTLSENRDPNAPTALIADAKWKLLDGRESTSKITAADLYQIQSYASIYQCRKVALLYPAHDNFANVRSFQLQDTQNSELLLVPIRLDLTVRQLADQLHAILDLSTQDGIAV